MSSKDAAARCRVFPRNLQYVSRPTSGPRRKLIRVLRSACSGELAAGHAYRGHWKSVSSPELRARIQQIEEEE